jgi:3-isopropylmalate/(R)-2-methylmalate dehydratase small subunit
MSVIDGTAWVFGDIDTNNMYPGFAKNLPLAKAARSVFYDLRPGRVDEVRPGDVVVAGRNFGIGSSRPVARLFRELGVAALIAEEFNSLFFRKCINFGLPALTVPRVTKALKDGDRVRVDVADATVARVRGRFGGRCRDHRLGPLESWPAKAVGRSPTSRRSSRRDHREVDRLVLAERPRCGAATFPPTLSLRRRL